MQILEQKIFIYLRIISNYANENTLFRNIQQGFSYNGPCCGIGNACRDNISRQVNGDSSRDLHHAHYGSYLCRVS